MNLAAWIDLQGLTVEVPLMIPLVPEGWTLPSIMNICINAGNIFPAILILLRWKLGKRFTEIPFIYIIITVGIIACTLLAFLWNKTIFIFGSQRSVWLFGSIFILAMLDCTSSLVFFDYMKRFHPRYLTANFVGEGITALLTTLLALAQGVGGEAVCGLVINGTSLEPTYTESRFSVTTYMLIITGIIILSLVSFCLLRWTKIISLAAAADTVGNRLSLDWYSLNGTIGMRISMFYTNYRKIKINI